MAQSIIQWANVRVEVEKELFYHCGKVLIAATLLNLGAFIRVPSAFA